MTWGWITAILQALLPWFFSGSTSTKVTTHPGLAGMDRAQLAGTSGLTAAELPALFLLFCLSLMLTGCAFGGAKETHTYHSVEPGQVVECVAGRPMKQGQVRADGKMLVKAPDSEDVGDYDPVGKVLLPKSVYRTLRDEWVKNHGETPTPDTEKK